jgi:tetratricopeptide (TPR) repeat protein
MTARTRLALAALALALCAGAAAAQDACPGYAAAVEAAWARYRAGEIARADSLFAHAHGICPGRIAARVGLGYTALRTGRLADAERWFAGALAADSADIDALTGRALVAFQRGDSVAAVRDFETVRRLDPDHVEAREFLGRLPAAPPPARSRLVLPDTAQAFARVRGDRFEVLTADGWRPFYARGINLGAALPGRFPSEFPDSAVYAGWIAEIGAMEANVIRLYTIHPPHFYQALRAYNLAHPGQPLRLIHGAWVELPPGDDYRAPAWEADFFAEMRRVVDVVHGRADLARRPGHAGGHYTADVARWVLAYVIGREWEPYSVIAFNRLRPADTSWAGRYVRVASGSPMDAWLGRALDTLVAYETAAYRAQRPVAYTNWPTLDPMRHPTETTVAEEVALRRAAGESLAAEPREFDNDAAGLDATLLRPTPAFAAGVFAAFHAYPYYPDFMVLDAGYAAARSAEGPSHYFGYLRDLKAHHPGMPVLIAEYGVPASRGIAHLQPQGWHHGGHTDRAQAAINARLTREIAEAGMAGGVLFAWIDEWFKRNWLVTAFELPVERNRFWLNRLDPEQMYGVVALEPVPAVPGATMEERAAAWRAVPPVLDTPDGVLRAAVDAGALWLRFDPAARPPDELQLGFDVVDSLAGAFTLAGAGAPRSRVGLELVLQVAGDTVRVLMDPAVLQFARRPLRRDFTSAGLRTAAFDTPPPGLFTGRWEQEFNRPLRPEPRAEGAYTAPLVVTNRLRFARDGTEFAAAGYDRGVLWEGPPPDGDWERDAAGALEIRIPWLLLNVADPSGRFVLLDAPDAFGTGGLGTVQVTDLGLALGLRRGARWTTQPADATARFSWEPWEEPAWQARRRPAFDLMREAWRALDPQRAEGQR